jgi:UDP-hydrolysing UDP-N-acetyl-D-glucosamine 2-epimerase
MGVRGVRKICIVTGSRADYGLLYWVIREVQDDPALQLQIIVTGMHLSPEFGLTYKIIEKDGFVIDERVESLLSSDTPAGIAKSVGLGAIGFADAFSRLSPDILVLLGDRYEIFAAAQAALFANIPIAHIAGGDTTEGAFDEAIRHSITKMAHLHFVTNEASRRRVAQLGENPKSIFNVGSPGIDYIKRTTLLNKEELEKSLKFTFRKRNLLITYHPVTLEKGAVAEQFQELLTALDTLGDQVGLVFTKPNADTGGRVIIRMIDDFVRRHDNARAFVSLGQPLYLSTLVQMDALVGNSSSGIYEAPSFKKPAVNIGDRQKGRLQARSVINCIPEAGSILNAISEACRRDFSDTVNPYGDGNASRLIVSILKQVPDPSSLLKKHFFEVESDR